MTRKDYESLALITGQALGTAYVQGGEGTRTAIYDALYRPLVALLAADNDRFDNLRFASAVGAAEASLLGSAAV